MTAREQASGTSGQRPQVTALLPLLAGVLWGTAFPALQFALRELTAYEAAFGRALLGALSLGLILAARGRLTWRLPLATWWRLWVLALLGAGIFWPLQNLAIHLSTPVNTAFLISLYPAFVAVAGPLLFGERLRRVDIAGLLLALAGAYLIISKGQLLNLFGSETLPGDLLALVAALSFGGYLLLGRRWRGALAVTTGATTFYTFALALLPLSFLAVRDGLPPRLGAITVAAMLWLGLMTTTVAFLAVNIGLSRSPHASRSVIHLLVIPLVAAFASRLLFGTTLTGAQWLGGGLVLLGIVLPARR